MANIINGTPGNDTLGDTTGDDSISGLGGNDSIVTSLGKDTVLGGDGNDTLANYQNFSTTVGYGEAGDDYLRLSGYLDGGIGNDTLESHYLFSTLIGGEGADHLYSLNTHYDSLSGGAGNDTIESGSSSNTVSGGDGADSIDSAGVVSGDAGNDTIYGYNSATISGGDGNDVIRTSQDYRYVIDGGNDDDLIYGTGDQNITGGSGNDTVDFDGARSAYTILYTGSDYRVRTPQNEVATLSGVEFLSFDDAAFALDASAVGAWIEGTPGNDSLTGTAYADYIMAYEGNNTLTGGGGNDTLISGYGAASVDGGDGTDLFQFYTDAGRGRATIVNLGGSDGIAIVTRRHVYDYDPTTPIVKSVQTVKNVEAIDFEGAIDLTKLGKVFNGNGANETFNGTAGDDSIRAGGGQDTVKGGNGNDILIGNDGDDSIDGGAGNNEIDGSNGNDTLVASGFDTVYGGDGNDLIKGQTGFDIIDAGNGNDTIHTSGNNDVVRGGTGDDLIYSAGGQSDRISGGDGNDTLSGVNATAALRIGYGGNLSSLETIVGSAFDDDIISFARLVTGGLGNDRLAAVGVNATVDGGEGNDSLQGGAGDERLIGGVGNDYLYAYTGNDTAVFAGARWMYQIGLDAYGQLVVADTVGGAGTDTVTGVEALGFDDVTLSVKTLVGDNDTVSGDIVFGGGGNDSLSAASPWSQVILDGGYGNDTLQGSYSNQPDILIGGHGDDSIDVSGADIVDGGDGNDLISMSLSTSPATITGGNGIDRFVFNGASGDVNGPIFDGTKIITDFVAGDGGETIDLRNIMWSLRGYDGQGLGSTSLRLVQDGADVLLEADPDAASGARPWETLIRFKNIDLSQLTAHNFGGYDPQGLPVPSDVRIGTSGADTMNGALGNDSFYGVDGDDSLYGGDGADRLEGGAGDDTLEGNFGPDTVIGGAGNDVIREGFGFNLIDGGDGDDEIWASGTAVTITGGDGSDTIRSQGDTGNLIDAGAGDDVLIVTTSPGEITLGAGQDLVIVETFFTNGTAPVITDFTVGQGGDTLHIDSPYRYVSNYSGGDPFASGHYAWVQDGGDAVLMRDYDGAGADAGVVTQVVRLKDVAVADLTWFNVSSFVAPTNGADNIVKSDYFGSIDGLGGDDWVRALDGYDSLTGGEGNDTLDGGSGDDTLLGGTGDDQLTGGKGNDLLDGGDGNDTVVVTGARADYGFGVDTSGNLTLTGKSDRAGGTDVLLGVDAVRFSDVTLTREALTTGPDSRTGEWLAGGAGDDWLTAVIGTPGILDGGEGDDHLFGKQNDVLMGGAGSDRLFSGMSDAATLSGGSGADRFGIDSASVPRGMGPVIGAEKVITDFTAGSGGDVLELEFLLRTLVGYNGDGFGSGSIRLVQDGLDTLVQVEPDGAVGTRLWETVYRLENVWAATLTAENLGGYDPWGAPATPRVLNGGSGTDYDFGGIGHDSLSGGDGDDVLFGRDGRDSIDGGAGNDRLQGDAGNDTVLGGDGDDDINDFAGSDRLDGGAGDDAIAAHDDYATVTGGAGSDTIAAWMGAGGSVDAGAGDDLVLADPVSASITLGDGRDVLNLYGWMRDYAAVVVTDFEAGAAGDVLQIQQLATYLSNYGGGDPFASGHLRWVQSGAKAILESDRDGSGPGGFTPILILNNVDVADLTAQNFAALAATAGDDALVGEDFVNDTFDGGDGDDWITGFDGFDSLSGGAGDDTITGGRGSDFIDGGDGNDTAVFSGKRADYVVTFGDGVATVQGAYGTDTVSGVEKLMFDDGAVGSNVAPVLTGDLAATVAFGGAYILTAGDIGFTDPDDTDVVFDVSNVKGGGVFVGGEQVTSFTSTDLAAGLVAFRHGGYSADAAGFDVTVGDGDDTSAKAAFAVAVDASAGRAITGFDAGEIELISKNAAGVQGNAGTGGYVGTPDGRYVLFSSSATNLVEGTPDDHQQHVYRKDLVTGEVLRVDGLNDGTIGNATAWATSISDDGNLAMFVSSATNFGPTGSITPYLAYTKNLISGEVTIVSTMPGGGIPDVGAFNGMLTPDGAKAYYTAISFNLGAGVPIDFSGMIYVKTLADGHTVRVDDFNSTHDWTYYSADLYDMTRDGGKILFGSNAPNLVAGDTNGGYDLFVLDTATAVIQIATVPSSGASLSLNEVMGGRLSADGSKVAFATGAMGVTGADGGGVKQVYVKDMATGAVTLISTDATGHVGNADSSFGDFSEDGNVVYFTSTATNLVAGDDNGQQDLFAYDLTTGTVTRVAAGNGLTYEGLSLNDDLYAFTSAASNLVAGDENGANDAFLMHVTGNDSLTGGAGNDTIAGKGGDDTLTGAAGDDALDGGDGDDRAVFSGNRADYTVSVNGANATVTGADGTDTLTDVEWLSFADGTVALDSLANVAPVLTGDLAATVQFGKSYVLTAADIGFTDPDDTEVFFDVSNVTGGGVFVNGQQSDWFSNDELAAGQVTFRHGGYTAGAAGFDVTVTDEIDTSAKAHFAVSVDDRVGRVVTGHEAGDIELISKNAAGEQVNAVTGAYMGSADGRYVVFGGNATNLVFDGQNDGQQHLYRKDLVTGDVVRIDTADDGELANSSSFAIDVSADGNLILFGTSASNLDADGMAVTRVFIKNVTTGEVNLLAGDLPNGGTVSLAYTGGFTGDASKVVFSAWSFDAPGTIDFVELLYVRSLADGTIQQLSDFNAPGAWTLYQANFSDVTPDGSKVLFSSSAPYLVADDFNGDYDLFVLDTATLAVSLVSAPASGEAAGGTVFFDGHISADGTKAVFGSTASSLTTVDTGGDGQVYVKDLTTGEVTLISKNAAGEAGNDQSDGVVFSADGKTVYFASFADNLVAGDDNGMSDIFAYDLTSGGLTRVVAGDDDSEWATSLTPDRLLFNSYASDLAGSDANPDLDVFLLHVTGSDSLVGGAGNDTLRGLGGNDTLDGGLGSDKLYGGKGNDTYVITQAGDQAIENANEGFDTVWASINYKAAGNIEAVVLTGTANIQAQGNALNNVLTGNAGNNTLTGGDGNDTLSGQEGNDKLDGGNDHDVLTGAAGNDSLSGGEGSDSLDGGTGNDQLSGGARWDTLKGGEGDDILDGGADNDAMYGGAGNDTYVVDHTGDRVYETYGEGTDTVKSSVSFALSPDVENLYLTGTGNTDGTGNGLHNAINGTSGNNVLTGGLGNDSLFGWDGNDSLTGGDDHDRLSGGNGNDTLIGGSGNDIVGGGAGADDFVFSGTAVNGHDHLSDFQHGVDRLVFTASDYGFAAGHALTAAEFTLGAAAVGTGAQFIWNDATDRLYWDADGSGAGAAFELAIVTGTSVTKDDLYFV